MTLASSGAFMAPSVNPAPTSATKTSSAKRANPFPDMLGRCGRRCVWMRGRDELASAGRRRSPSSGRYDRLQAAWCVARISTPRSKIERSSRYRVLCDPIIDVPPIALVVARMSAIEAMCEAIVSSRSNDPLKLS